MDVAIVPVNGLPPGALDPLVEAADLEGWGFVRRLVNEWAAGLNRFDRPGERLFVARAGGEIVGVCGLTIDPYTTGPRVGRVRRLYVLPAHRGAGIGRRLVRAVVREADGRFRRLRVRTDNPAAARLYEGLGFRAAGDEGDATHVLDVPRRKPPVRAKQKDRAGITLLVLGLVGVGLIGVVGAVWAGIMIYHLPGEPEVRPLAGADFAAAEARYGFRVVTPDGSVSFRSFGERITADPAPADDAADFGPLLVEELDLYPADFVRRIRVRHVVPCTNLTIDGHPVAGYADCAHGDVYLSLDQFVADEDEGRRTLHHEMFHVLDYRDDGKLDRDPVWAALNPPGFRYGNGGRSAFDDPTRTCDVSDDRPGFLNGYSTSGIEEDKAEVFSYLVVNPGYVAGRAERDPVLRAKVARMKSLLAAFCPAIDAEFWRRLDRARGPGDLPIVPGERAAPAPPGRSAETTPVRHLWPGCRVARDGPPPPEAGERGTDPGRRSFREFLSVFRLRSAGPKC